MRTLHILTGLHHGAEIPLHSEMTLGSSDRADIVLLDEVAYDIQLQIQGDGDDGAVTLKSAQEFQWIAADGTLAQGHEAQLAQHCLFCIDGIYCIIKSDDEVLDFCVEDVVQWFENKVPAEVLIQAAKAAASEIPVEDALAAQTEGDAETNPQGTAADTAAQAENPVEPTPPNWPARLHRRTTTWWDSHPAQSQRNLVMIGLGIVLSITIFAATLTLSLEHLRYDADFATIISYLSLNPKDLPQKDSAANAVSNSDALLASQTLQLREEILSKLEKYSIRDYIKFDIRPEMRDQKKMMVFNFSGDLTEPEDNQLQGLLEEIKKQHDNLRINGHIDVFQEKQPKTIAQIIFGDHPVIVDNSGARYAVGDTLEGKKIVAIQRDRLIFKGKRNLVMTW